MEDEFDRLPDAFEGIVWEHIPALRAVEPSSSASIASNLSVPASSGPRFSTLELTSPKQSTSEPHELLEPARHLSPSESSSQYEFDEGEDLSFMAEVEEIENRFLASTSRSLPAGNVSTTTHAPTRILHSDTHGFFNDRLTYQLPQSDTHSTPASQDSESHEGRTCSPITPNLPRPISRSSPGPCSPSLRKRAKPNPLEHLEMKRHLEAFEDELTCAICCDIFTTAHMGIPCGHSFCGECGWNWISKNLQSPTCAVCRAKLSQELPMVQNFALDNAVQKHVESLAAHGIEGWETNGEKREEWEGRKRSWAIMAEPRKRKGKSSHPRSSMPMTTTMGSSMSGREIIDLTGSSAMPLGTNLGPVSVDAESATDGNEDSHEQFTRERGSLGEISDVVVQAVVQATRMRPAVHFHRSRSYSNTNFSTRGSHSRNNSRGNSGHGQARGGRRSHGHGEPGGHGEEVVVHIGR